MVFRRPKIVLVVRGSSQMIAGKAFDLDGRGVVAIGDTLLGCLLHLFQITRQPEERTGCHQGRGLAGTAIGRISLKALGDERVHALPVALHLVGRRQDQPGQSAQDPQRRRRVRQGGLRRGNGPGRIGLEDVQKTGQCADLCLKMTNLSR